MEPIENTLPSNEHPDLFDGEGPEVVTCGRCSGEGYVEWEEDGRYVRDACYHCGTTGKIDVELLFEDQLKDLAGQLAGRIIDGMRRACNADPYGEGWAFLGAENMMHEYEYTQARLWDKTDDVFNELQKLSRSVQEALVELLVKKGA